MPDHHARDGFKLAVQLSNFREATTPDDQIRALNALIDAAVHSRNRVRSQALTRFEADPEMPLLDAGDAEGGGHD